jgi:hypothetical protein
MQMIWITVIVAVLGVGIMTGLAGDGGELAPIPPVCCHDEGGD